MSRSGYTDDGCDEQWAMIRWRGAVASAIRGARGQAFLKEMLAALHALERKRLIREDLESHGEVCAIGAVGGKRGIDMSKLAPGDRESVAAVFDISPAMRESVAAVFDISPAMAAVIVYMNDEWGPYKELPEDRYTRMRRWVEAQIKP